MEIPIIPINYTLIETTFALMKLSLLSLKRCLNPFHSRKKNLGGRSINLSDDFGIQKEILVVENWFLFLDAKKKKLEI